MAIKKALQFMLTAPQRTVHNLLFYVHTLWLNNLTVSSLLASCLNKIKNLLLSMDDQG